MPTSKEIRRNQLIALGLMLFAFFVMPFLIGILMQDANDSAFACGTPECIRTNTYLFYGILFCGGLGAIIIVVASLVVLIQNSGKKYRAQLALEQQGISNMPIPSAHAPAVITTNRSSVELLAELKSMLDQKLISPAEFEQKKKEILDRL